MSAQTQKPPERKPEGKNRGLRNKEGKRERIEQSVLVNEECYRKYTLGNLELIEDGTFQLKERQIRENLEKREGNNNERNKT